MVRGQRVAGSVLAALMATGSVQIPVRATSVPAQQLAQITPSSVTDRLDENSQVLYDGSYFNSHTFEGTAGETIRIDMASEEFDAYLILLGPDGGRITQDDDSNGGTNARILVTLPSTGTYQILANSYRAGAVGGYVVTWQPANPEDVASAPQATLPEILTQILLGQSPEDAEAAITQSVFDELLGQSSSASVGSGQNGALQRASALNQQAAELYQAGRYEEAGQRLEEALAIWQAEVGDRDPSLSSGLSGLALIYRAQGRFAEAESLYQEALSIDREHLGDRHPDVAQNLSNLGALYVNQGRYGEAEPLYKESIDIWREQLGDRHPRVAGNLHNLAGLYRLQGRYSDAESLLQEALAIYREHNQLLGLANGLSDLATLYYDRERYDEAEQFLQESLTLKREQLGDRHVSVGNSLNGLALLYVARGQYEKAEPLYQEALSIRREQSGARHPAVAQILNNLANLYRAQKRYEEAEQLYQESLSIRREQLAQAEGVAFVIDDSFNDLSRLYAAQGKIDPAIGALKEGLDIQERYLDLNLATMSEAQRQAYAATLQGTANQAISLSLESAPESFAAAELALTTLLRRKGRSLDAGASSLQVLRQNLTPEDQAVLDNLTVIRQRLATLIFNPPANLSLDQYQSRLAELEAQADDLASTLARRSAVFRAESEPAAIASVRAQIPSNKVLVEYVRYSPADLETDQFGPPRYAAYLLFSDGRIEAVDLGDAAEIDAAVQSFTRLLQDRSADFQRSAPVPTLRPDIVEGITDTLSTLIFDPIAPYLQDAEHLLISPDGQLNLLPFEALQTEAGGEYLVQRYQISYLNSGRDLLKFDVFEPSQNPAVIVANPDYEAAAPRLRSGLDTESSLGGVVVAAAPKELENRVEQLSSGVETNRRSTELKQFQVNPLPGTAAEAESIRPLLPNADIRVEAEATENLLKSVESPRILHIATHGFFLPNVERPDLNNQPAAGLIASDNPFESATTPGVVVENPLLRSGLALAGFNTRSSGDEDGVFTALEASQLNLLGTQLVVLSACDTGLGDVVNGEGVYGLRRAFAIAGAETQLISLWQVSDFGTQSLMARYYQNLTDGMGRSEALRAVQLEMIAEGGEYSHPYYWAAFILAGEWGALR